MTATVAIPQRTRAHRPAATATYRRRRSVATVALVTALSALGLGAHAVLTDSDSVPASAVGVGTAPRGVGQITAQPGDSLWSIAEDYRSDAGVREYVDELIDLNGGSTAIAVGQVVRLP